MITLVKLDDRLIKTHDLMESLLIFFLINAIIQL